jgi:uncharacterized membrane protein (UPF0127 family)
MTALIAALLVSAATSMPAQQLITRDARPLCVPVASTPQQQAQGLMGVHKPRPMVFSFNPPQQVSFWMKDTPARLTGVWVASGGLVIGYWHGKPYSTTLHNSPQPVSLVIEYPRGYRPPTRGSRVRLGASCKLPSGRL